MAGENVAQIRIRITDDLRAKVEESAAANGRSVNSEYETRIAHSFKLNELSQALTAKQAEIDSLVEEIEEAGQRAQRAEATRSQDQAALQKELTIVRRSWDDTQKALVDLRETITRRLDSDIDVAAVVQYLVQDIQSLDSEVEGRARVVLAAPPRPPAIAGLAAFLRSTLDQRTSSMVRLALKMAGVEDADQIERKLYAEHALNRGDLVSAGE